MRIINVFRSLNIIYILTPLFLSSCAALQVPSRSWDFNNNAIGYDPKNSYWLARISDLAYQDRCQDEYKKIGTSLPFTGCEEVTDSLKVVNGAKAIVLYSPDIVIIAFRGTMSMDNALSDAADTQTDGGAHVGFEDLWFRLRDNLECKLRPHLVSNPHIWVTGHSLGGAVATLAVNEYDFGDQLMGIYTFGKPKVGNEAFSKSFNDKFGCKAFHVVHNNDYVPQLPISDKYYSENVGNCVYIGPHGNTQYCAKRLQFWDGMSGFFNGIIHGRFTTRGIFAGGHTEGVYSSDLAKDENLQMSLLPNPDHRELLTCTPFFHGSSSMKNCEKCISQQ